MKKMLGKIIIVSALAVVTQHHVFADESGDTTQMGQTDTSVESPELNKEQEDELKKLLERQEPASESAEKSAEPGSNE